MDVSLAVARAPLPAKAVRGLARGVYGWRRNAVKLPPPLGRWQRRTIGGSPSAAVAQYKPGSLIPPLFIAVAPDRALARSDAARARRAPDAASRPPPATDRRPTAPG